MFPLPRRAPRGGIGSRDDGRSPGSRISTTGPVFPNPLGFSDPPQEEADGPAALS